MFTIKGGDRVKTYNHGIQTRTGEARGADEVLGGGEEGLVVGLEVVGAI